MNIKRQTLIIWGLIFLGIAFLAVGVLLQKKPHNYYAHSLRNYQEADTGAGYPIAKKQEGEFWTAQFQPALHLLTSVERYRTPEVDGFERPEAGSVKAAANGLVVYSHKTVVLAHRLEDHSLVLTSYGPFQNSRARVGQLIARGEIIGDAEDLQFEIRKSDGINFARTLLFKTEQFLKDHPVKDTFKNPLTVMKSNDQKIGNALENLKLDSKSAETLSKILGGD